MNKDKAKLLLIVLGIILGFVVYFLVVNRTKEVYTLSYDGKIKYILSEEKVKSFRFNHHTRKSYFTVKNSEDFIKNKILKHPDYKATYHHVNENLNREIPIYVLNSNSYYFYIWVNPDNTLVLYSAYAEFDSDHGTFYFPFFYDQYFSNEINTMPWGSIKEIKSFDDVARYYRQCVAEHYRIDEENQAIYVKAFNMEDNAKPSSGYPIKISFHDEGLIVELLEEEL